MEEIRAALVLEILGRPKEHVEETLTDLVNRLGEEKGVKILNKKIQDTIPAKDSGTLFTSFAEIDLEFDSIENYFRIMFNYMPSHIEIVKPEKITLTNSTFNELGNSLINRLHNYDAITKKALVERNIVMNKMKEIAPEEYEKLKIQPKETEEKKKE
jgi:hypothetical protein